MGSFLRFLENVRQETDIFPHTTKNAYAAPADYAQGRSSSRLRLL